MGVGTGASPDLVIVGVTVTVLVALGVAVMVGVADIVGVTEMLGVGMSETAVATVRPPLPDT